MPQLRWSGPPGRWLVLLATVALHPACGGGGGGGLTEPTTGVLQVITSTIGTEPDADGYTVTLDDVDSGTIGPAARRTIEELEPGAHQVGLSGVAGTARCRGRILAL